MLSKTTGESHFIGSQSCCREKIADFHDSRTSIHWHGIRQFGESNQDGANGVTECPIPPGKNITYAFHVTQYGTSW